MIEVKNVSKKYDLNNALQKALGVDNDSFLAVDNVSFKCVPGRVFSLLGPNGAGKTTLLRMISSILKPSSGDIWVNGVSVREDTKKVRKQIGFLTGSTNLYGRLNAHEIVQYFADLHGMDKAYFRERKALLFDQLNIHEFAGKRCSQLSVGMKQKVSIARSLIHNPDVIIFDEPTSGLDVITAHSIVEIIKQCKDEGKTVIFSSHIMSEVEYLCDDLAIIAKGRLLFNDTLDEFKALSTSPSLTETFIEVVNGKIPSLVS